MRLRWGTPAFLYSLVMPVYEYRCERGHLFDVIQRMADDPLTECNECGALVQRVFHPIAVHFKGSGFYSTDYGKSGGGDRNGTGDSSSSSESSGSEKSGGERSGGEKSGGEKSAKEDKKATTSTAAGSSSSSSD